MIDDEETDFCDRLPGQHTGRLSLELQASEAAEWQRKIDELECRLTLAEDAILMLTTPATPSAAVGADRPGAGDAEAKRIIATAVERDEFLTDVDGFAYYWPSKGGHLSAWQLRVIADELDRRNKPWQEQIEQDLGSKPLVDGDTFPKSVTDRLELQVRILEAKVEGKDRVLTEQRDEIRRLTKLNHHLREAAVMAIVERVPSDTEESDWKSRQKIRNAVKEYSENTTADPSQPADSKPTNVHNPESEDTPPHNPVMGPVVGTAKVKYHDPEPCPKWKHVCFYCEPGGNQTPDNPRRTDFCWRCGHRGEGIRRDEQKPSPPSQQAESPDDWVTQDRVPARVALDEYRVSGSQSEPGVWKRCIYGTFPIVHGYQHGRPLITGTGNSTLELRCRRKDLPVVPAESPASQSSCSPVCALCGNVATCFGQYADHDKGFACDSCCGHGNEDGWCMTIGEYDHQNSAPSVHSPSLSSPWRPMTEVPNCDWFWLAWNDGQVILSRDRSHWNLRSAAAWMPAVPPLHPNAAPSDKPRMLQVTLREYVMNGKSYWTTSDAEIGFTDRTVVTEVPE